MTRFRTLDDLSVAGKTVLVRVDFNVPMKDGRVTDTTRIERALPTLRQLLDAGAKVVLLSHFGRPKGVARDDMSLKPLVPAIEAALPDVTLRFAPDCVGSPAREVIDQAAAGSLVLLENLRFHCGEEKNGGDFADALSALGNLYVNDAFSAAHRAHASVDALARRLPAAAGRLMQAELEHLSQALENPARPVAALVGGAKVSTKLALLGNLVERVELLIVGGGMANTFLLAQGLDVGKSLCERDMAATARDILDRAEEAGCDVMLPSDVVTAGALEPGAATAVCATRDVPVDSLILDAGPQATAEIIQRLESCKTLVWNGPLGAFEVEPFDRATVEVARAAADMTASGRLLTVAGGGDTVAALSHAGVAERFSYVSTAGGAFLEWLEGKRLPGVVALEQAAQERSVA